MRGVVYEGGEVRFRTDLPLPAPGPDESLVRVCLAAVCNTDREVARGYRKDFSGVMGHEFVGVVECSESRPDLVGRRVVGELNAGCGRCVYCKTGRENHCADRKVLGIHGKDGCFAEYMTLRSDLLHPVPDDLPDETAIFTEPLAAAVRIPQIAHLRPGDPAAVVGDGRLAYLCAQVLALSGAAVTVFGRHPEKLERFAPFAETRTAPEGGFELVVEATGSPSGLADAIALTRSQGRLVLKSTYAGTANVDMSELVVREITVQGSRCGPFDPALRLLRRGLVTVPPIELHPLENFRDAFASRAFKAGFRIAEKSCSC